MYSQVIYTGNGVTRDFVVPFPYLDQSHVAATVNGAAASFTWLGASTVRFNVTPFNGSEIRISRDSSRATRISNYQDAQLLTEASMDFDALQIFYVAQEAFDAVAAAAGGGDMMRSLNLSDVFDVNAARNNIGAVAKAGDTMLGPLLLAGAPSAPNEATTKAYVDAVLGAFAGGGVTSFNTRTGNVTLMSSDVTSALAFTPVNKAGDIMLGPLTLAADPANPLQAATKQYVDARVGATVGTGEYIFTFPADPALAAARLTKNIVNNTGSNAGAAQLILTKTGGIPMVSFNHQLTLNSMSNGDIGMASVMAGFKGGVHSSLWGCGIGPRTNPGNYWQVIGAHFNANERVADQGLKLDRSGNTSMSVIVAPANNVQIGDGPTLGYNTSFGIAFTASNPGLSAARMWTPLFFEMDSTAAGGVMAQMRGGSTPSLMPRAGIEMRDNIKIGIDTRNAVFDNATDNTAIWLAQGQAIHYGPLQRIYVDPSGNLTFFDNVVGTKTLAMLGGGAGTNLLPLSNTWTGVTNKFIGPTAESTGPGAPGNPSLKVSRTSPAGGAVQVQVAQYVSTTTQATSNAFEWNSLFHLENFATGGENVGLYSQVFKRSTGPTWGGVFEARDSGGSTGSLYCLELDLCSDGLDPNFNRIGIGLYYGANTNTLGSGSTTKQTYGILLAPFVPGRNQLFYGVRLQGYMQEGFSIAADGLAAFRANGQYSAACIDISTVTNTPIAVAFAPGSRMQFSSGVGNGGNTTFYGGGFVPNYVGAIEVLVDGVKRYIPLALNHP